MTAIATPAWIGLGSNLDEPEKQILRALVELGEVEDTRVLASSHLYRSPAWGITTQPDFVNAVAHIDSGLPARDLLNALLRIEKAHGRCRRGPRWGPRTLDLDLLVYGDARIEEADLHVPHPRIRERAFVLRPLAEIAATLDIPGLGRVADLLVAIDHASCVAIDASSSRAAAPTC